ncbi:MAG TPA: hypothetical protein VGG06_08380 [Thermoanaerobaculia bacterium]|jgi:predicted DNA-binding transcriptional regulator AlpA
MGEYQFTLVISGDVDRDDAIDALFAAGCDDATIGTVDGVGYADFVREAPSFGEAVGTAIKQVESVPGLQVRRVEPDDLVTMTEIAERLRRSRESVRLLVQGARGPGGFPPPVSHLKAKSRLWRWSEVAAWAEKLPASRHSRDPLLIAAINAALALRESASKLLPKERQLVQSLR